MAQRTDLIKQPSIEDERSAEEIRRDIAARRQSITNTVEQLNSEVHRALDWRNYVGNHPMTSVAVAAGAGFLLARVFRRRQPPLERLLDAAADSVEDLAGGLLRRLDYFAAATSISRAARGAAVTFGTKAVADYLKRRAVGSHDVRTSESSNDILDVH
jgi:ElaB/YqjD/DUF883 family membrane-anchored ribosome-binding protein